MKKGRILVTGGTGFVGSLLTTQLIAAGYTVYHLSRSRSGNEKVKTFLWDVEKEFIEKDCVEDVDHIIHLAGTSIGEGRWTNKRKRSIIESRIKSAEMLYKQVLLKKIPLKTFISASAVGYYGSITTDKIFTEEDAPAKDFTGEVCRLWEAAADKFLEQGSRVVKVRTAIVLGRGGAALEKITLPIKMGVGSPIGTGKQWFPWIHIDDLCGIYLKAIEDSDIVGAYNAVAPEHVTNEGLVKNIAKVLKKPLWMPNVPAFVLKLALGELGDAVLNGSRVSPKRLLDKGFHFQYPELEDALKASL
jgi:uncharacterized protein